MRSDGGIVRAIHGPDPFALARYGASLRLSKFVPDKFVEPGWVLTQPSPPEKQNAPRGGVLLFWRRGWDSNPRYAYTYA